MTDQDKAWRQQSLWAFPAIDAEQDDTDAEPSLGSLGDHHADQEQWAAGDRRDLEQDPSESGIGDHDGLLEQIGANDWQQGDGMMDINEIDGARPRNAKAGRMHEEADKTIHRQGRRCTSRSVDLAPPSLPRK